MDDSWLKESTNEFRNRIINSLAGKCIAGVGLPDDDEPLSEILLVLDDGSTVLLAATSEDGTGVIAWGSNVVVDPPSG